MKKNLSTLLTVGMLTLSSGLLSSTYAQFVIPNSFSAGTPIKAADMNVNFQAIQSAVNTLTLRTLFGATFNDVGPVGWSVTNTSSANVIYGVVGNVTLGGKYSAGIKGADTTPGLLSYGVEGNSKNGTGVYGSSDTGGGVVGFSSSGPAVKAISGAAGGTALELDGAIKVSGTVRPAFVHTATSSASYITCIDHPLTNDDPNAIVTFVHSWTSLYYTKPFAIYYSTSGNKWCIFSEDISQNILSGTKFNVIVFKQ